MTPEAQLLRLYQQWRALTQAEAVAIQGANWANLLEAQSQKKSLQQQIEETERCLRASSEEERVAVKGQFKETLHELILLEQQNAAALEARKQDLQQEQLALEKSSSNLHHLQRAYAPSPGAVWQSYS